MTAPAADQMNERRNFNEEMLQARNVRALALAVAVSDNHGPRKDVRFRNEVVVMADWAMVELAI